MAFLCTPPIMAVALLLNRGVLGLTCVALAIFCARSLRRAFAAAVYAVLLSCVILISASLIRVKPESLTIAKPEAALWANVFFEKQQVAGLNNKTAEWISLYRDLSKSSSSFIFGLGWGGQFDNPAVGQVASFTHSLISYALLKAGLLGVGLLCVYLTWVICTYFRIDKLARQIYAPELYAVNCVVLISLFLQPTYKTPTYGVLLLLMLAVSLSTTPARVDRYKNDDIK